MKKKNIIKIVGISFLYALGVATALIWIGHYNSGQLKNQLTWVIPRVLEINFCLIILAIILNLRLVKKAFSPVSKRAWILLLTIMILGTAVTAFEAPRIHRIFYDEDIYLNIGQNIACEKRAGMCNNGETLYGVYSCHQLQYAKEPYAWPYLVSVLYQVAGISHMGVHILNNVLWALSIAVVFVLAFLFFRDEKAGLYAALLLAILPEGIRWSNTTAAETSAALFGGLALLSLVWFIRNADTRTLFLAVTTLAFAFQFRPESVLIMVPAGLALLVMMPKECMRQRFYVFLLVLLVLSLPHIVHLYCVRSENWGAPLNSSKLALAYFYKNIAVNGPFYYINQRFPLIVTLLAIVGMVMPLSRAQGSSSSMPGSLSRGVVWGSFAGREKMIIVSWFLAFWGIFLFFYAGSYNYGADVRFSLLSHMPLALMGGYGAAQLCRWIHGMCKTKHAEVALSIVIVISFLSFMPYIRAATQEAWSSRFDHRFAKKIADSIPDHSMIFTHNPNMFLLWGKNAAQASIAMSGDSNLRNFFRRYTGGVYFHYNYWCTVNSYAQPALCNNILKKFHTEKIMWESERGKQFALYRLHMKEPDGSR